MFPLQYDFRNAEAEFYSEVRWAGSRPLAIDSLRRAIAADPNNAGLRRNLAGFLIEDGKDVEAGEEIDRVRKLVPRGEIALFVNINPVTR